MGRGIITEVDLLRQTAKVRLDDPNETLLQVYPLSQLGYTIDGVYKEPEPPPPEPEPAALIHFEIPEHEVSWEHEVNLSEEDDKNEEMQRSPGKRIRRNKNIKTQENNR